MADNETLVSWRFDMDKFSDHLCEWVPVWVCYLGPRPGDLGPAMQPHAQLLAQKTIPENELQIGSTFLHFFDKFQVLFAIQILLE